eukprot:Opistho-1_new@67366
MTPLSISRCDFCTMTGSPLRISARRYSGARAAALHSSPTIRACVWRQTRWTVQRPTAYASFLRCACGRCRSVSPTTLSLRSLRRSGSTWEWNVPACAFRHTRPFSTRFPSTFVPSSPRRSGLTLRARLPPAPSSAVTRSPQRPCCAFSMSTGCALAGWKTRRPSRRSLQRAPQRAPLSTDGRGGVGDNGRHVHAALPCAAPHPRARPFAGFRHCAARVAGRRVLFAVPNRRDGRIWFHRCRHGRGCGHARRAVLRWAVRASLATPRPPGVLRRVFDVCAHPRWATAVRCHEDAPPPLRRPLAD